MSASTPRSFHFATTAQWSQCLAVDVDVEALRAGDGIRPFAVYERTTTLLASDGAQVPVVLRGGDLHWRDDHRQLHRLTSCDDVPEITPAPSALASTGRIVSTASGLWAIDGDGAIARFEADTLTRLLVIDLPDTRIVDIADAGRDSLFVLGQRDGAWLALRLGVSGHVAESIALPGIGDPIAFTYLRSSQRVVVLDDDCHQRLYWFALQDGLRGEPRVAKPLFNRAVAGYHPCFGPVGRPNPCASPQRAAAHLRPSGCGGQGGETGDDAPAAVPPGVLTSDRRDRIYLAGQDGASQGGAAWVLLIDADGNPVGNVPVDPADAPPTGVAAGGTELLVTGARGLLRYARASVMPEGADQTRCVLLTPMLHAPEQDDGRRWLRIDAQASLPEGSAIEIAYASTDRDEVRDRLVKIAADGRVTASQRLAALLGENDIWHAPTTFTGTSGRASGGADPFSAKLFDTRDRYVWVRVVLTASAGAALPQLTALDVRYPGQTLMASLPGIYQREESNPDSFLRALVGVLESTTQGTDARIAQLARHLDPSSAAPEWLNFVARWLGVPWDDGMDEQQKRRVLRHAALLASTRGTRAGLETLLEALVPGEPGSPRRFRVVDGTADHGFARVGGGTCRGSALPAMLGGPSPWNAPLDDRAVLGCMRLPCPNQPDDGVGRLAGRIRVDVAATAAERAAWQPWIERVLGEMVPVTARLTLRWVSRQTLQSNRLDGTLTLDAPPLPHLGTDAITNVARLPGQRARLSCAGTRMSTKLR